MEESKGYLIPKNVKTRFEIFEGFGWKELFMTLAGVAVGGIFFFLLGLLTKSFARIFIVALFGSAGFSLGKENPKNGLSLLTFLISLKEFQKRPKRYYYIFGSGREDL